MIDRNDLFEKWLNSLDIPLMDWQKEVLRVACTQPDKQLYISMPKGYGRLLTLKLIEQYKQMIKGEKEMQKKLEKFNMADIHSGYVVRFRNGKLALCMRVGEKFTKIFACLDEESQKVGAMESETFTYAARYSANTYYRYNLINKQYENYPDLDIVEVYGLIEGVRNYLNVGDTGPISIKNRPLIWSENKKMTLEEIEKALGFKVEIVVPDKAVGIKGVDCKRCVHRLGSSKCAPISVLHNDCDICKQSLGLKKCPCNSIYAKDGEPCPYFEEEK